MKAVNDAMANDDVYAGTEGVGFDNMGGDKFTMPMLLIAQDTSEVVRDKVNGIESGCYYNSVTKENYGKKITLVIAYFESVWQIWKPNMGGFVGRVRPNSIPVNGDVFKGMTTKDGNMNDVIDTWLYFVLIKDREDEGVLMMPLTSNSIKYAKVLNGMIHDSRMSSGKRAPLFYNYWELGSGKTKFDKGNSYSFGEGNTALIKCLGMVPGEVYLENVKEATLIAPTAVMGSVPAIEAPTSQLAIADSSEKY